MTTYRVIPESPSTARFGVHCEIEARDPFEAARWIRRSYPELQGQHLALVPLAYFREVPPRP